MFHPSLCEKSALLFFSAVVLLFSKFSTASCLKMLVTQSQPLGFIDKAKGPEGFHYRFLKLIQHDTGICLDIEITPRARIWKRFSEGEKIGTLSFRSVSKEKYVDHIEVFYDVDIVVVPISGNRIGSYSDLRKYSIVKVRGTTLGDYFDADKSMSVVEVNSYKQVVEMAKLGRINAVAGGINALNYHLNVQNALAKVNLDGMFKLGANSVWLQIAKTVDDEHLISELKAAVSRLRQDGSFRVEIEKFMSNY